MANAVDDDTTGRVLDGIEDSIVTRPDPVRVGRAFQFLGVGRSGVGGEGFDGMLDAGTRFMGQAAELPASRRRVEDRVHGRDDLGIQRSVDFRHRNEPVAPMSFEVG